MSTTDPIPSSREFIFRPPESAFPRLLVCLLMGPLFYFTNQWSHGLYRILGDLFVATFAALGAWALFRVAQRHPKTLVFLPTGIVLPRTRVLGGYFFLRYEQVTTIDVRRVSKHGDPHQQNWFEELIIRSGATQTTLADFRFANPARFSEFVSELRSRVTAAQRGSEVRSHARG
jgi:hypothetical protein